MLFWFILIATVVFMMHLLWKNGDRAGNAVEAFATFCLVCIAPGLAVAAVVCGILSAVLGTNLFP